MGSQRVGHDWATYTHTLTHLLTYEMSPIVWQCEHSLALPFFGIGIKTDPFQSCGHYWVFQICWHIECSILTASSFRIWNSSAGITSPPLDLFVCSLWAHIYMQNFYILYINRYLLNPYNTSIILSLVLLIRQLKAESVFSTTILCYFIH